MSGACARVRVCVRVRVRNGIPSHVFVVFYK